jgi:MFS family permease
MRGTGSTRSKLCARNLGCCAGVRRSLLVCFFLEASTRIIMTITTSLPLLYLMLYTVMPASGALGVPVMTIAIKRYSTPANRGFAYGLFYTVMNLAALANGFLLDFLRVWLCDGFNVTSLPPEHWLNDGNRLIVASGAVTSLAGLCISFCFRAGERSTQHEIAMVASLELDQVDIVSSPLARPSQEPVLSRCVLQAS